MALLLVLRPSLAETFSMGLQRCTQTGRCAWAQLSTLVVQVVCGELGESVLEQLSSLSQDVVLPLLSNPANHVGISEGVGREVKDRLHQFIADGAPSFSFSRRGCLT